MSSKDASPPNLELDARAGWPAELRFLLDRYPREVWPDHANLGDIAQFWLQIHNGFRDLGGELRAQTEAFREGRASPEEFRAWFAPRLRTFLSHLQAHHQIEDYQFFPLFSAAEPRLVTGFEVLEKDHENIHHAMLETVDAANALLRSPLTDRDALRFSADPYAATGDALLAKLIHHLDDEEDLIIPLILDKTEGGLGIG